MLVTATTVEVPAGAADAGLTATAAIVVRTYSPATATDDGSIARRTAGAILKRAGIHVDWLPCDATPDEGSSSRCDRPLRQNELVIRILPASSAEPTSEDHVLGVALVDARTGSGSLATVYSNRVERMAQRAGVNAADLLGKAIAHELGHLLLGHNRHASSGLMRACWSGAELRRNRPSEWLFDGKEAASMRRGIEHRVDLLARRRQSGAPIPIS